MKAPYGTWTSPLGAADVAAGSLRLEVVAADAGGLYWLEGRPAEGGRTVLVARRGDGTIADVTPPGTNVRTRAHEYGGGACLVSGDVICYAEFADQRLYRLVPGRAPQPLTPPGPWFYADAALHPSGHWLVCVREDHSQAGREPETTLVRVNLDRADGGTDAVTVVAHGFDFYSTPRFSADGTQLSWLAWRHPQMPWDGTEAWVAQVGDERDLRSPRRIAGGPDESIVQPGWSPDGRLYFVSDRTGWWNLYRLAQGGEAERNADEAEAVCPMDAEFAAPQWQFGA